MSGSRRTPKSRGSRGTGGTRDRLIAVSLALFNERGPDRVTTAQIAEAAGINEGNLYYYFKTKQALILAVFGQFEDAVDKLLADTRAAGEDPAPYVAFLSAWFEIVWAYRFIYRDFVSLLATAPELRRKIRLTSERIRAPIVELIDRMCAAGLMEIGQDELLTLMPNVWIVSTYWVVYLDVQEGVRTLRKAHLAWGLGQVASLFRPYLTELAQAWLVAHPEMNPALRERATRGTRSLA
jgi:AcrR family transcriptional regulator